ncbi:TPA: winged helix-turn-helix domain-containing protein [Escherichia fergusonii]|nr:hypothetical protein Ef18B006LT_20430 [Escherichia fergusonii]HCO7565866.1 winged helix-turn-helix domain-containing protein [Escherichia fergusonii]HDW3136637.1 winged helix-turn-helix domain-containing protein [Escherichia fergusonii]
MNWSNTINEHSLYMFENFLFSSEGVLRCKDKEVYLPPKEAGVLTVLLKNYRHIVSKEKIINDVWNNAVSDESLTRCVYILRNALGKDNKHLIETVYNRGYKINATVTVVDGSSQTKYEELYHNFPHQQSESTKIGNTLIKLLALIDAKKIDGQFDGCEFDSLKKSLLQYCNQM